MNDTIQQSNPDSIEQLAAALSKAQGMMGHADKNKVNNHFKSSYSDIASILDAIKIPFAENNLSLSQVMDVTETGRMILISKLMHTSGQSLESKMLLPDIQDPQKLGGAITYFRKYSVMAIAGLAPAEDDDGNAAAQAVNSVQAAQTAKERPVATILPTEFMALLQAVGDDSRLINAITTNCGVKSLKDISKNQLQRVHNYISNWKARQGDASEK